MDRPQQPRQERVANLRAKLEAMMEDYYKLRDGLKEFQQAAQRLQVTASSPDGYIKATVGPRGQLIRLELDPRIYRQPNSRALAQSIVETVQRAATEAADKLADMVKPFMPAEELQAHMKLDFDGMLKRADFMLPGGDQVGRGEVR